ncbi:MAG: hypothetical protein JXB35_17525 [Anaerolineae bacterium]|nr:hypothetical protein [Anaerolineae bacterium]
MDIISYAGWDHCVRLANERIELLITSDVGPRILRLAFLGQENEFAEFAEMLGQTGGDIWRSYGGHRLWHAPEEQPRTYYPDNAPVAVEDHGDFARFIAPLEVTTRIQKEIDVALDPEAARVTVVHRLRNTNLWSIALAPWALSVMAPGGTAIIPLPPRGPHPNNLLPNSSLVLWVYTDMADPRWTWGTRFVLLRQDPEAVTPQKAGAMVPDGWVAYARNGHLFVKTFDVAPGARYPDLGCNVETFTNGRMLEAETLGPLVTLAPGAEVEYVERWALFDHVPTPTCDADVAAHVLPLLEA